MTAVLQNAVDAVSAGALYALAALGIALIFGVMRMINFAHGALITIGAYAILALGSVPWPVIVLVTLAFCALGAVTLERVAFRPVREANMATLLVTSFAVSALLQNLIILVVGADTRSVAFGGTLLHTFTVGGVRLSRLDVVTIVVTLVLLGLVALFLERTRTGLQVRATTENFGMARMLGVRANRVIAVAFAISGALAGAVALLLTAQTGSLTPTFGLQPVVIGFVATIIGGMGSLVGAVAGGFGLGILTVVLQATLPVGLSPYNTAFTFACVILFLVVRPDGLFGAKLTEERV